jgi:hypothetical protein
VPANRTPIGSRRDRYLAILIGVVVGYFVGRYCEDHGWPNARLLTMPVGGLLAGVIARFTVPRFRDPTDPTDSRRLR